MGSGTMIGKGKMISDVSRGAMGGERSKGGEGAVMGMNGSDRGKGSSDRGSNSSGRISASGRSDGRRAMKVADDGRGLGGGGGSMQ